jgi:6-phosphofructo-2-kinase/fructose-2,6-biphosphatase 2
MDENGFPKLACVMVGLPARGKTFIARKVARYLNWLGHQTRIINVGDYRRTELGVFLKSDCFDPNNQEYAAKRSQLADRALADMIAWFNSGDKSRFNIDSEDAELNSPCAKSAAGVGGPSSIALYDATNSTKSRREKIANSCNEHGIKVMFIESICDDPARILQNIREVKVNCPDYQNFEKEEAAINDFQARIQQYEKCYESISETELQGRICFVKLLKLGTQIKINNLQGYLQSRIVYFLMNLNIHPRSFYISRHGESMFNTLQKIGGNSPLSERGLLFASKLPEQIAKIVDPGMNLVVWTSTLKRFSNLTKIYPDRRDPALPTITMEAVG